jgi:hypothetical protein
LGLEAFGELAILAADTHVVLLLLGDDIEEPAWRDNFSVEGQRAIVLDVALLGELLDVTAMEEDTPAVLLSADLFGVARCLPLADPEEASNVFDRDIDRCLVRFHDERV